jgi:hypothetical protein
LRDALNDFRESPRQSHGGTWDSGGVIDEERRAIASREERTLRCIDCRSDRDVPDVF